jgi:uncharacterized membrane protein (DUF485 family)
MFILCCIIALAFSLNHTRVCSPSVRLSRALSPNLTCLCYVTFTCLQMCRLIMHTRTYRHMHIHTRTHTHLYADIHMLCANFTWSPCVDSNVINAYTHIYTSMHIHTRTRAYDICQLYMLLIYVGSIIIIAYTLIYTNTPLTCTLSFHINFSFVLCVQVQSTTESILLWRFLLVVHARVHIPKFL